MRISNMLQTEGVLLHADISAPADALGILVELQENQGIITNGTACYNALFDRENAGTTAIGGGIALPHAVSRSIQHPGIAALTLRRGIEWGAEDKLPVDLFFMITVPPEEQSVKLQMLARLVNLLANTNFVDSLREATSREGFLRLIAEEESAMFA
jgi:PTS system fructose-specific IIC component